MQGIGYENELLFCSEDEGNEKRGRKINHLFMHFRLVDLKR